MKKALVKKIEKREEEAEEDNTLQALLHLIRMQDELDKKLQLLVIAASATLGE